MMRYNLQFFGDDTGKTEQATSKKLRDARSEGQVAKSADIPTAFMLMALFLVLKVFVRGVGNQFIQVFQLYFSNIPTVAREDVGSYYMLALIRDMMGRVLIIALPFMAAAFLVGFVTNVVQVKWQISTKPLKPKFSHFNPVSGFKQMFSTKKVFELLKSIVKVAFLGYVVVSELRKQWATLLNFYDLDLYAALGMIGDLIINLGIRISLIFLVIAFIDLAYQKRKFKKDMMMTKQEVKDEHKMTEGDPKVKSQLRSRMFQASRRRMMQELPQADVVITNPTHLAVAIRYNKERDLAPVVVAKGADYLAERIREVAGGHGIEIVENKPLARMLYYNVELGMEIPPELYQMVAEILAYVYNVKGKVS